MNETLLTIEDLAIHYFTDDGVARAVNGLNMRICAGETVGLVGETGAGKTTTALGIMRLTPSPPGRVVSGKIMFQDVDLLQQSSQAMRKIRGNKISMIFQDPMTSLNPVLTVGDQVTEVIRLHQKVSRAEATMQAACMLEMVGIPAVRLGEYPHQFSGGMRQRAVIAMALACNPALLIADEPTTALDVTIQAQVLDLIAQLQKEFNTSVLLITHDLGVVAETCDKVAIMYAGGIVESGTLADIFKQPSHPYTRGLFASVPSITRSVTRLNSIPGHVPDPTNLPSGCAFAPRCPRKSALCEQKRPVGTHLSTTHYVECHHIELETGSKVSTE